MKIEILLATYNGTDHIKEQLDSLFNQTYNNFEVIIRDDISTDSTVEMLKSYNVKILESKENIGVKESFSFLLDYAVQNTNSEYFMFCDQDDVWKKDKIEKTLKKIQEIEKNYPNIPILVHTDLKVVDENLNILDDSFWKYEHINPSLNRFNRLLIQNTITGCTVMINRKLAELVLPIPDESIMHDWWLGLVASNFGRIGFIKDSTIQYRQHSQNSIGAKGFSYLDIIKKGLDSSYRVSIDGNIEQGKAFLNCYRDKLDKKTIEMLVDFIHIENKSFWQKRKILLKHKLLKQGFIRNIGLLAKI